MLKSVKLNQWYRERIKWTVNFVRLCRFEIVELTGLESYQLGGSSNLNDHLNVLTIHTENAFHLVNTKLVQNRSRLVPFKPNAHKDVVLQCGLLIE